MVAAFRQLRLPTTSSLPTPSRTLIEAVSLAVRAIVSPALIGSSRRVRLDARDGTAVTVALRLFENQLDEVSPGVTVRSR